MFEIICFIIGIIILGIMLYFAFKNRFKRKACLSSVMIGILLSTFVMVLPIFFKASESFDGDLYAALQSLIFALKTIGGGQDHEYMADLAVSGWFRTVYLAINYICFIACPLMTSSLILSFIGDAFDKMLYHLSFNRKCYVFSALNEKSLNLLSSMGKKGTVIFCNSKDCDESLKNNAKRLGGILVYCSVENLKLKKNTEYRFYLIEEDQDNNVEFAQDLINKHQETCQNKIVIYAFTESGTNVNFLESLIAKNSNVEIRCIDEIALMCNDLIFKHPLYVVPQNSKTISVAIVGLGRYGLRMLKTVCWAGQIEGYNLKIRAYDKQADVIKNRFYSDCPEVATFQNVEFIKIDVDSVDFKTEILKPENSLDATYIVIAMGDDQLNLTISDELYRLFRRSNNFDNSKMPNIFTRVRSDVKTHSFLKNAKFLTDRNIHLFGTLESIYSNSTLFNSAIENLAFAVHLTYWGAIEKAKDTEDFNAVYSDFRTNEYERRASMAAALHLAAKLVSCGAMENTKTTPDQKDLDNFKKWISDDDNLDILAKNEHLRWNVFMASEGYVPSDFESIKIYSPQTKNHKDLISKSHPCIIPWDDLDELEEKYNALAVANGYKVADFKKYDREIVERIPDIFTVAKKLNEER